MQISILPDETSNDVFNASLTYGSVTDVEGTIHKTITIGTLTWMAENLRATRYRNEVKFKKIKHSLFYRFFGKPG